MLGNFTNIFRKRNIFTFNKYTHIFLFLIMLIMPFLFPKLRKKSVSAFLTINTSLFFGLRDFFYLIILLWTSKQHLLQMPSFFFVIIIVSYEMTSWKQLFPEKQEKKTLKNLLLHISAVSSRKRIYHQKVRIILCIIIHKTLCFKNDVLKLRYDFSNDQQDDHSLTITTNHNKDDIQGNIWTTS